MAIYLLIATLTVMAILAIMAVSYCVYSRGDAEDSEKHGGGDDEAGC